MVSVNRFISFGVKLTTKIHVTQLKKTFILLTDHATREDHMINWSHALVIDRERGRFTRWIKEAVHSCKEVEHAVNQDAGSYQLSHAYDHFLDTTTSSHVKMLKKH